MSASRVWPRGLWIGVVLLAGIGVRAAEEPTELEITAAQAKVMSEKSVVGTVSKGETFRILKSNKPWYRIAIEVGGEKKEGWILERDVKLLERPVVRPRVRETLQVTADRADVRVGSEVIGVLRKGELRAIRETNGAWWRVEVTDRGERKAGWLSATSARVVPETSIGPSLSGLRPVSVTQATIAVDWQTKRVTLESTVPLPESPAVKLQSSAEAEVSATSAKVTLSGDDVAWSRWLSEGTRSLWLIEGEGDAARAHRRLSLRSMDPAVPG